MKRIASIFLPFLLALISLPVLATCPLNPTAGQTSGTQACINRGQVPGDGTGDTLYNAGGIINTNFNTLFSTYATLASPTFTGTVTTANLTATGVVSGAGFTNLLAPYATLSGPTLTGTTTVANLTATGTVSGAGFTSLLSPYLTSATAASTYAPLASPTFTGTVTIPTPTAGDNSTKAASTAFVHNFNVVGKAFVGTGGSYGGTGTTIPTSSNPIGDYTTQLIFQGDVRDDTGALVNMANSRLVVPSSGYSQCRITYNLAWGVSGTSTFTANTTSGSAQLTSASSTTALLVGIPVSGTGIPAGAQVIGISGTTVYLNMPATATGTTVTITASNGAVGFRGMRVKNSLGSNYGNVRIPAIATGDTTTNNNYTSPWITISTNSAPDSIAPGDYFTFWPAQTSGASQTAGADAASSFVQLECR